MQHHFEKLSDVPLFRRYVLLEDLGGEKYRIVKYGKEAYRMEDLEINDIDGEGKKLNAYFRENGSKCLLRFKESDFNQYIKHWIEIFVDKKRYVAMHEERIPLMGNFDGFDPNGSEEY